MKPTDLGLWEKVIQITSLFLLQNITIICFPTYDSPIKWSQEIIYNCKVDYVSFGHYNHDKIDFTSKIL